MPRPTDRRSRLVVLLLVATLFTGLAATVSAAPALPACKIADTLTKHRWLGDWHRSLLDPTYRLASSYVPTDLRSTSYAGLNAGYSVRRHVIDDLKAMASAARAAGARLAVQSAYRSYKTQKSTFEYWVRVHGYATAIKESARAGHSEHQLGTTIDFRAHGGLAPWDYRDFGSTKVGKWLIANAWRYGFVMSYPKGKTTVTCYQYEPWHYRYVGRTRAATIRASGLTLREFLWREQNTPAPTPTPSPTPTPTPTPTRPTDAGADARPHTGADAGAVTRAAPPEALGNRCDSSDNLGRRERIGRGRRDADVPRTAASETWYVTLTGPPRRDLGVPIATMILDADLTPVDASAAALELIGATIDELRRLPPGGLAAEPTVAGSAIALRDAWKASGTPELGGETTIRRLDGRRVRVRFGLTPMGDGRFLAILEPVSTPVERADVIYTAGQVLAEWRAAERRMSEVPGDSPEGRRIRADIEVFRARYQDVFRSNANRPRPSTNG